jgi:lipoprotein-anchoring transpeptidase ErfK/SrfK
MSFPPEDPINPRHEPSRIRPCIPARVQTRWAAADNPSMGRGRETIRITWTTVLLVLALLVATPAAARAVGDTETVAPPTVPPVVRSAAIAAFHAPSNGSTVLRRPHSVEIPRKAATPPPAVLVRVTQSLVARARPASGARAVGVVPTGSKYYHVPLTAWMERVSRNGRWGRVEIPYVWPRRDGWVRLSGLTVSHTSIVVEVDLSSHTLTVTKSGKKVFSFSAATGASWSPTPPGEYFVTDRIAFGAGGPLGSFAFGISGIQPHLPAGWSGGNQLAIHGTSNPASIGHSASAGCVRVSETALSRLKPLLVLGTPIVIHP